MGDTFSEPPTKPMPVPVPQDARTSAQPRAAVEAPAPKTPPRKRPTRLELKLLEDVWPVLLLEKEVASARAALASRHPRDVRIVTWNVWFDALCGGARQEALLKEVLAVAPDVACFQEVLPGFAKGIWQSKELNSIYKISQEPVGPYGLLTMARHDLAPTFKVQRLPTGMGRTLLAVCCNDRCPGLVVVNVHLESLNNEALRREQLQVASSWLGNTERAVVCGDFNFDATKTWGDWMRKVPQKRPEELENHVLKAVMPSYRDVWAELRPGEPGYTFDGEINGICCKDSQEQMRYDRIMARAGHRALAPRAVEMLGMEPINDWGLCPSDHFGLLADLTVC